MSYSWGDDTGSSRSKKSGYDYRSARETYKETGSGSARMRSRPAEEEDRKSHDFRSARGKTGAPISRAELAVKTESTHPVVVCIDHTGSFKTEVGIVLEKLPLLGVEVERYIPEYAICFSLIGDTTSDSFPFQVRDFDKGISLDTHIKALYPEGDGGDAPESYDLAAYYFTHHCEMPNAVKPLFIWVLDSNTRRYLAAKDIKNCIGDTVQSDLDSGEVLKKLTDKFTVYVILKGSRSKGFWTDIVGDQNVIPLEEPRDIVEMIIGIVAGEVGEYEDFEKRSSKRHSDRPDRVSRVMKSTASVKAKSAASGSTEDGMKAETSEKSGGKSMRSKKLA